MKQIIRLHDIYSADLYTRSRASELRARINDNANEVTIDFEGIGFMSCRRGLQHHRRSEGKDLFLYRPEQRRGNDDDESARGPKS